MIHKLTRQIRRRAAREGIELVAVEPEPLKLQPFHKTCGTSLIPKGEEIMCPRCNVLITNDSEFEMLPVS